MPFAALRSVAYDDEESYDLAKNMPDGYDPPEYPTGLCFSITRADLDKAAAGEGSIGDVMRFSAMGEVTSVFQSADNTRVELMLKEFAGDDGKFFDLSQPVCICLCGPELEKMELEADCERGDTIHLIGTVRLESLSDTEYGGEMASLQIIELGYEDESAEARR